MEINNKEVERKKEYLFKIGYPEEKLFKMDGWQIILEAEKEGYYRD